MPLNNKKKQNEAPGKAVKNIACHFSLWQTKWAARLQQKTAQLSCKGKLIVLISFCLWTGGFSVYVATGRFFDCPNPPVSFGTINPPQGLPRYGNKTPRDLAKVSRKEYHRIHRFKLYMDSLVRAPAGKSLFDSITALRPGLMDSLILIENIYQLQNKR